MPPILTPSPFLLHSTPSQDTHQQAHPSNTGYHDAEQADRRADPAYEGEGEEDGEAPTPTVEDAGVWRGKAFPSLYVYVP